MKVRRWLEWHFIKEGFKNLFWNFHYLTLFGIFTLLSIIGVITIGPAIMALASSTRLMSRDEKVAIGFYFSEFRRHLVPGLFLSGLIILCLASLWSSLRILTSNTSSMYNIAAYIAISIITALSFFIFYYPFAGFEENRIIRIIMKSFVYTVEHLWDTVVQISILYILWNLLSISLPVLVILFLPFSTFIINRFILANNRDIDEQEST